MREVECSSTNAARLLLREIRAGKFASYLSAGSFQHGMIL